MMLTINLPKKSAKTTAAAAATTTTATTSTTTNNSNNVSSILSNNSSTATNNAAASSSKSTKSLEESILDIINDVFKRQFAIDFREPVDVMALGLNDYYDVVTKPMDLTTLKNKFLDGEHSSIQAVWDDFNLIVDNCKAYNRLPDHPINAKADQLKARVDKNFNKVIEDFQAAGVDTATYSLSVDQAELKAKEDKKRKIKLDGLDEKNILMKDKRQQFQPGTLNEKKLFDLQNEAAMGNVAPSKQQQSQNDEYMFNPPSSVRESSIVSIHSNSFMSEKQLSQNSVGVGSQAKKQQKEKNSAESSLKHRIEGLKRTIGDLRQAQIEIKHYYSGARKARHVIHGSVTTFLREEDALLKTEQTSPETDYLRNFRDDEEEHIMRKKKKASGSVIKSAAAAAAATIETEAGHENDTAEDEEEQFMPKSLLVIRPKHGNVANSSDKADHKASGKLGGEGSSMSSIRLTVGGKAISQASETSASSNGVSRLPAAPDLKKDQSQRAAEIILMDEEKKLREQEDMRKAEEAKRQEELRRRERMLKRKELQLLQGYQKLKQTQEEQTHQQQQQQSSSMSQESQSTTATTSATMIKIPMHGEANGIRVNRPLIGMESADSTSSAAAAAAQLSGVVNFKFVLERKSLRREYESMQRRKQQKYRKLLEVNLGKMQKVTGWMIREWGKQKKEASSETLEYFKVILADHMKICENLDVRKIQLFLKMFLYRLRDFNKDLKQEYIEKLKNISEKMYRIGSRAIVYKQPLPHRDNPENAGCDVQVSNTQILEESHPLKRLQEEILEIEREMKQFRRMLSRDIQKYTEMVMTSKMMKKPMRSKDDMMIDGSDMQLSGHQSSQQQSSSYYMSQYGDSLMSGGGYFDRDRQGSMQSQAGGIGGVGLLSQEKQSEIMQFFSAYNRVFENSLTDLSRVTKELGIPKDEAAMVAAARSVCWTHDVDNIDGRTQLQSYQQVDLLEYIKKKRKLNAKQQSDSVEQTEDRTIKLEEGKPESEELEIETFTIQKNEVKHEVLQNVFGIVEESEDEQLSEQLQKNVQQQSCQPMNRKPNENALLSLPSVSAVNSVLDALEMRAINAAVRFDLNRGMSKRKRVAEVGQIKVIGIQVQLSSLQNGHGSNGSDKDWEEFSAIWNGIPYSKRQMEDPSLIRCNIRNLVVFNLTVDIKTEREFSDASIGLKDEVIEFKIRNKITHMCHAFLNEIDHVSEQLKSLCIETESMYTTLCPEAFKRVVDSIPINADYFTKHDSKRKAMSTADMHSKDVMNRQAGCIVLFKNYSKIRPTTNVQNEAVQQQQQYDWFQLHLQLLIPFHRLSDLFVSVNNVDIFNPKTILEEASRLRQR